MKKWSYIKKSWQAAYTLIEVLAVVSIFIVLAGLTTMSLLNAKHKSSLSTSVDIFITDLKLQQLKAMTGDTEGRETTDNYGVYFGADAYTFFHGTYSSGEPSNFTINLGDNVQFSDITFPSSQIIFLRGSGEVSGFNDGSNTITIKDIIDNQQKIITINRYGVVTEVN